EKLKLEVDLRTPKLRADAAGKVAEVPSSGLLITPDALLPFTVEVRDDNGLNQVEWKYTVAEVEFELQTSKDPKMQFKGDELLRLLEEQTRNTWAGLIVSGMHFWPMGQNFDPAGPAYWAWWISRVQEVRKARAARQKF